MANQIWTAKLDTKVDVDPVGCHYAFEVKRLSRSSSLSQKVYNHFLLPILLERKGQCSGFTSSGSASPMNTVPV